MTLTRFLRASLPHLAERDGGYVGADVSARRGDGSLPALGRLYVGRRVALNIAGAVMDVFGQTADEGADDRIAPVGMSVTRRFAPAAHEPSLEAFIGMGVLFGFLKAADDGGLVALAYYGREARPPQGRIWGRYSRSGRRSIPRYGYAAPYRSRRSLRG